MWFVIHLQLTPTPNLAHWEWHPPAFTARWSWVTSKSRASVKGCWCTQRPFLSLWKVMAWRGQVEVLWLPTDPYQPRSRASPTSGSEPGDESCLHCRQSNQGSGEVRWLAWGSEKARTETYIVDPCVFLPLWGTKVPNIQILPNFQTTFPPEQILLPAMHRHTCVVSPPGLWGHTRLVVVWETGNLIVSTHQNLVLPELRHEVADVWGSGSGLGLSLVSWPCREPLDEM